MDRTKSSKGSTKGIKYTKQVLHYPPSQPLDKDKHSFKVEENDFPSLSEVHEKNPKSGNDSSANSVSLLTYSSKLKTLPVECSSQSIKYEKVQHDSRLSKNEPTLNKASSGRNFAKPPSALQPNHQSFTQQSSTVCNAVPSKHFSEVKSKKPESSSEQRKVKMYQRDLNDNRSKTAHGESSTFEKNGHFHRKGHNPNNTSLKSPISKNVASSRNSNAEYSSVSESERLCLKENNGTNVFGQHKRHGEINRSANLGRGSGQGVRSLNVSVMHGNVSRNASNKARIASSSGQMAENSIKLENSKTGNQSLNLQSSLTGMSESKKKKKRKSKLKRQAALQTGKILVLTPEVHSKIVNQSNNACVQKNQNVLTNINDEEEYPQLGVAEPKTIKESHMTVTNMLNKVENSTNLDVIGSETDGMKNLLVSKDDAPNNNLEATLKPEQRNASSVEKPEIEKPSVHSNNPITLSLFDMLATAKPRKKEPEKKDESIEESNTAKSFKKEMIKKNVHQAVNPLASSKPTIKRGKEREKPKIKRPSRMRKLILMERQLRKENMALKMQQAEDENQEKSEEIAITTYVSDDSNQFQAPDDLETCVEDLQSYLSNTENNAEVFGIFNGLHNASEQLVLGCEDANSQSVTKNQTHISEKSKLSNEIENKANHSFGNHVAIDNNESVYSSVSYSILDNEKKFVSNPASSLTDNKENFLEELADINTIENFVEIRCSNITNLSEKLSDLKIKICETSCIDRNLALKSENTTDKIENIIPGIADGNIIECNEFNNEKRSDLIEAKKMNQNLHSSEKAVSTISSGQFSDEEKLKATKLLLHSRKFRKYCNHFISKEIDQTVFSLIDDLARFQDRMYQKDPVKAKIRRRLVYGIKEIKKHMKLKKVKCIIIATDIEDVKIEGGLNDSLGELISLAEAYQIPCVFSHWRYNLGKVCRKSVPVSCVGIFNYEGSEKNFKKMIELHDDSKYDYLQVTKKLASELTNDQVKEIFEAEKESIIFLREVSQRILREMVYFTPEGYKNSKTSELEKSIDTESGNLAVTLCEDSNLLMNGEKSLSFIEEQSDEFKKLYNENLLQNESDINTILVKYKVVK